MHNDTPLGTLMHFKELDRQAAARSRSLRPVIQGRWRGAALVAPRLRSQVARLHRACRLQRTTCRHDQTGPVEAGPGMSA